MKKHIPKIAIIIILLTLTAIPMLVNCSSGIPNDVHTIDDVEGRRIGALQGTPSMRLASNLGVVSTFDSSSALIEALVSGHIDCIIMESTTAEALVARSSGVRILQEPIMDYDLRIAVPRENTSLLVAVNAALAELRDNSILMRLYNKYFAGIDFEYQPPETAGTRSGTLTVALPSDSPPLSFVDPDTGNFVGLDAEVAIAVSDIIGVDLVVLQDPGDLITAVWHGRADLAMGWHPDEVEDLVHASDPYAIVSLVVIVRN